MLGVANEFPVPIMVVLVEEEYQLIVPDDADAPKVSTPSPQRLDGVVFVIFGGVQPPCWVIVIVNEPIKILPILVIPVVFTAGKTDKELNDLVTDNQEASLV